MPPIIYFHMGQPKTGTNALQKFCHFHREELKALTGLYYPRPHKKPSYFKHANRFPFEIEYGESIRREVEESGCTRLLFSAESLCATGVSDEDLKIIRSCFPCSEIFFIFYLRRLDDYCRSFYNQRIKDARFEIPDYPTYLAERARLGYALYPSRLLQQCENQVGRDHILVRIYDRNLLKNGNIIEDMFDLMGVPLPDSLNDNSQRNLALPSNALPYMTGSLMRASWRNPLKDDVYASISRIFSRPNEKPVDKSLVADMEREIELLDSQYVPGYKKLFEKRPFDLSFPELAAPPQDVLTVELLYRILFELRDQRKLSILYWIRLFFCEKIPREAGKVVAFFQKLFGRGNGGKKRR